MLKLNKFKSIAVILLATLLVFQTVPSLSQEVTELIIENQVSEDFNKQLQCLTKNIYYESATESYEGKLAVAQVTINRANSGKFPSTICEVVYQRTFVKHLTVCQFSWTCLKNIVVRNKYAWEESEMVARKALTEPTVHDRIAMSNAMYYHADYVNPGWNRNKVVTKIGRHIFYSYD